MFEEILVPLDGSAQGWKALSQAVELAKAEGSIVHGLYVVDVRRLSAPQAYFQTPHGLMLSPYARTDSELEGWYREWGTGVLHTMEDICRQCGVISTGTISRGFVERVICQEARLADLIVFGHQPHRGNGTCHRGSALEIVIRRSKTPVLVVTNDAKHLHKILLTYNGRKEDSQALHMAARFSHKYGLPLTVMVTSYGHSQHVKKIEQLESYLKPYSIKAELLPTNGTKIQSRIGAAEAAPVDMIFTGTYRHNGVFTAITGSTLDNLIDKAPCPVLICP
jgi:nucleotide-binding universal stress UspA family protein